MVQQHIGGAGRSHAQKRPDDARRRHRRLEHVGLEPLIEKVGRAHRHQLNLVVAVLVRQRAEAPRQEQQLAQLARVERHRIGRRHAEDRLDEPRHLHHRLAVFVVGFGVELRVASNLTMRRRVIVHAPEIVAVRHRRERAVERQNLQPVARQIQIADDFRPQQRDDVGADREFEPGKHLLGHRGAAEHVPPLEHEDLAPRSGEIGSRGQPVMPAADDNGVVFHRCVDAGNAGAIL